MHLADTFPHHTSCTQKVTQLSYKHLSMPTGMSQKQTGGCSSVRLLHTYHEGNSSRKLYLKSPLALHPICNTATDTPVTYQLHSQPSCHLLTLLLKCVCTWRTQSYAHCNRNVLAAHRPFSLEALHSPVEDCQVTLPPHNHTWTNNRSCVYLSLKTVEL